MPTILSRRSGSSGGSLPSWWTVDSTPGSESVEFAGAVLVQPSDTGNTALQVEGRLEVNGQSASTEVLIVASALGQTAALVEISDENDLVLEIAADGEFTVSPANSETFHVAENQIGFFGATPVAKPTGVAVSAAGIHAALVTLGLIAA